MNQVIHYWITPPGWQQGQRSVTSLAAEPDYQLVVKKYVSYHKGLCYYLVLRRYNQKQQLDFTIVVAGPYHKIAEAKAAAREQFGVKQVVYKKGNT
jgi:hypothetical protein